MAETRHYPANRARPPRPGPDVGKLERDLIAVMRRRKTRAQALAAVDEERNRVIRDAHAGGVQRARIADITELTPQRIDQIRRGERI